MTTAAGGAQSLNLELLIKLLKLSASDNDAEALLALRKATEVLKKFGGDWEALLRGKVTVIADPFTATAPPPPQHHAPPPRAPVVPKRAAPVQPQHSPSYFAQQQAAAQQKAQATQAAWQAQQRQKAAAQAAAQATPATSRNTLRKMRVQLDDLA